MQPDLFTQSSARSSTPNSKLPNPYLNPKLLARLTQGPGEQLSWEQQVRRMQSMRALRKGQRLQGLE